MKKIFLMLPVLLLGLAACGGNGGSVPQGGDSTPHGGDGSGPVVNKKTEWTQEEKDLMNTVLHHELPFIDMSNIEWYLDTEYECLSSSQPGKEKDVDTFATQILANQGWEELEVDDQGFKCRTFYFALEHVELDEHLEVDAYSFDNDFYIDAYYFTAYPDWDETIVAQGFAELGVSDFTLPKPTAKINYFDADFGYTIYGMITFYVGFEDNTINHLEQYVATLTGAGYTLKTYQIETIEFEGYLDSTNTILVTPEWIADANILAITAELAPEN